MPKSHRTIQSLNSIRINTLALFLLLLLAISTVYAVEAPFASDPCISPDGHQVCFAFDGDLWLVDFNGGIPRRITNTPSEEWNPQWSPDGKTIAFSSFREGNNYIYLIPASGGEPFQIIRETMSICDWFNDSQSLLCSKYDLNFDRSFYRVPISGVRPTLLAEIGARYATLSPDNTKIVFQQDGNGYREAFQGSTNGELWLLDIASKKYQQLTHTDLSELYPRWSHTSNLLYYTASDGARLQLMRAPVSDPLKGKRLSQITRYSARDLSLARANDRAVFELFDAIYKYDPTKPENEDVTKLDINLAEDNWQDNVVRRTYKNEIKNYDVSPNGLLLGFSQGYDSFFTPLKGGDVKQITCNQDAAAQMLFLDDRNLIINLLNDGKYKLFKARADSLVSLQPLDWFGADSLNVEEISRDRFGRWMIKYSDYFRHDQIAIADSGLTNIRKIDTPWSVTTNFAVNKSGTYAVYGTMRDDSYIRELYLYNLLTGENRRLLADDGWLSSLIWTPDNKSILLTRNSSIYRLDLVPRDEFELDTDNWKEILAPHTSLPDSSSALHPSDNEQLSVTIEPVSDAESLSSTLEKDTRIVWEGIEKRFYQIIPSNNDYLAVLDTISDSTFYYIQDSYVPDKAPALKKANIYGKETKDVFTLPKAAGNFAWNAPVMYYLDGAQLKSYNTNTSAKKEYQTNLDYQYNKKLLNQRVFEEAWGAFGENFYDPDMHGQNWKGKFNQYLPYVQKARSIDDIAKIVNEMIGDVNASHTGFYPRQEAFGTYLPVAWLGVEFDRNSILAHGIKISAVYPTSRLASFYQIQPGDTLLAIDGVKISSYTSLDSLLADKTGKKIRLQISHQNSIIDATLTGLTFSQQYELWYTYITDKRRRLVDEISHGQLGYVHIRAMGNGDWEKFYTELFRDNYDKKALVIDVRGNSGGHIHDQIISLLQKKRYALSRSRGQSLTMRYEPRRSWDKPTIVLVDDKSFSDGEIFPTIYQELKLGKVVGVPSSGSVIGTWQYDLMDGSSMRLPGTGWYKLDGTNMEGNGTQPDIVIKNLPEDRIAGQDKQLERAVQELLSELKK